MNLSQQAIGFWFWCTSSNGRVTAKKKTEIKRNPHRNRWISVNFRWRTTTWRAYPASSSVVLPSRTSCGSDSADSCTWVALSMNSPNKPVTSTFEKSPVVLLRASTWPSGGVEMPAEQMAVTGTGEARDAAGWNLFDDRFHHLRNAVLLHQQRRMEPDLLRILRIRMALVHSPVAGHLHLPGERLQIHSFF